MEIWMIISELGLILGNELSFLWLDVYIAWVLARTRYGLRVRTSIIDGWFVLGFNTITAFWMGRFRAILGSTEIPGQRTVVVQLGGRG